MRLAKQSQSVPLQNFMYFITLPFLVRKIFTFYINDVLLFKCPIPGTKGYSTSLPMSSPNQASEHVTLFSYESTATHTSQPTASSPATECHRLL